MNKRKKIAVFELIQSMEKTEKGYFMKFAKMSGEKSNYVVLFKIISKLEHYNEDVIVRKLKKKEIIIKQLSVTLHRLYLLILKSLRLFHEKNYHKSQVNNLLMEVDILLSKRLKVQAIKLLKKAEGLARKYHYFSGLIEINKIKIIHIVANTKSNLMEDVQGSYQELKRINNIVKEEIELRERHHSALICYRVNSLDAAHRYSDIVRRNSENKLLSDDRILDSFYSKYKKESVLGLEALIYNDRGLTQVYYKKIIQIWDDHPHMIKAEPALYIINIVNYLFNSIIIKDIGDFDEQMVKLEKIPTRFLSDRVELFQNKIYLKQLYHLNYKKLNEAYADMELNKNEFESFRTKMNFSRFVTIQYNYLIICFLKGDFKEGLRWINEMIHKKNTEPKTDVRLFCRIMELVLHYELGNFDLVESLLQSVWKTRKTNSSFYNYTEVILNHFKRITKAYEDEMKHNFELFLEELKSFESQSPQPIGVEELTIWTKSKIKGKTIEFIYMNSAI